MPHQGAALISAPWPAQGVAVDATAVAQFEALKDTVRGGGSARRRGATFSPSRASLPCPASSPSH
jgi:hypothetical protein